MQAHHIIIESRPDILLGIISPDGRDAMLQHAQQFKAAGIPFVFDPGQGLPMFSGDELKEFISLANWVTVNDYEAKMLCDRTGLSCAQISSQVHGLIVTLGDQGCEVWVNGCDERVPAVTATVVRDPTGCGDAFRSAVLFGLEQGWSLKRCAQLGSQLGARKIASRGGQNYVVSAEDLHAWTSLAQQQPRPVAVPNSGV